MMMYFFIFIPFYIKKVLHFLPLYVFVECIFSKSHTLTLKYFQYRLRKNCFEYSKTMESSFKILCSLFSLFYFSAFLAPPPSWLHFLALILFIYFFHLLAPNLDFSQPFTYQRSAPHETADFPPLTTPTDVTRSSCSTTPLTWTKVWKLSTKSHNAMPPIKT